MRLWFIIITFYIFIMSLKNALLSPFEWMDLRSQNKR